MIVEKWPKCDFIQTYVSGSSEYKKKFKEILKNINKQLKNSFTIKYSNWWRMWTEVYIQKKDKWTHVLEEFATIFNKISQ